MIKQVTVHLGNKQNIVGEYDFSYKWKVEDYTGTYEGRVFFGADYSTMSYTAVEQPEHSCCRIVIKEKNYFYFLVEKTMENSNVFKYTYVLDCKSTYPEVMYNGIINRTNKTSLLGNPMVSVEYPHQISKLYFDMVKPRDEYYINTTKKLDDKGIATFTDASLITSSGIQMPYDTFIFDGVANQPAWVITSFRFISEGQLALIRDGRRYDYKGWAAFTVEQNLRINPGEVADIPSGEGTFEYYVEFGVARVTIKWEGGKISNSNGTLEVYVEPTMSTVKTEYIYDFNKEGTVLGFPTVTPNYMNTSYSIKVPFETNLATTLNRLQADGRKIISVQKGWIPSYTTSDVTISNIDYRIIKSIANLELFINCQDNLLPEYLCVYGNMIKVPKHLTKLRKLYFTVVIEPSPNEPKFRIIWRYKSIVTSEDIETVPIMCNIPYTTSALQEYSLYNSQAQAIYDNSIAIAKRDYELEKRRNQAIFIQNMIAGTASAGASTAVTYGWLNRFGNNAGGMAGTIGRGISGITNLGVGISNYAGSVIYNASVQANKIADMEFEYNSRMQQIKDQPSNYILGSDINVILALDLFGIKHFGCEWLIQDIQDFIDKYGVMTKEKFAIPENDSGYMSLEIFNSDIPNAVYQLYKLQTAFFYKNSEYSASTVYEYNCACDMGISLNVVGAGYNNVIVFKESEITAVPGLKSITNYLQTTDFMDYYKTLDIPCYIMTLNDDASAISKELLYVDIDSKVKPKNQIKINQYLSAMVIKDEKIKYVYFSVVRRNELYKAAIALPVAIEFAFSNLEKETKVPYTGYVCDDLNVWHKLSDCIYADSNNERALLRMPYNGVEALVFINYADYITE